MFLPDADCKVLLKYIDGLTVAENEVVFILLCQASEGMMTELVDGLNRRGLPFFGGSFPGLIRNGADVDEGAIIQVLPALVPPIRISSMSEYDGEFAVEFESVRKSGFQCTALVLVDGLGNGIEHFLFSMFNQLGDSVNYLGGGAGSISLNQQPCLFSPEGVFQNGALIAFLDLESRLGVCHGWTRMLGPLVVTRARGNIIYDINWSNAFEVYRSVVSSETGLTVTRENFFSVAKEFPFGLYRDGNEDIVRDPIAVLADGGLLCVGEVPENAVIHILRGTVPALIASAGKAASDCLQDAREHVRSGLVVDCISRKLFLREAYSEELSTVRDIFAKYRLDAPEGALTLGEISSYGEGLLAFFNKTIVTSILYERRTVPT